MTGCAMCIDLNMCLQFSVDNYILQALTEYGDSLQSLVTAKIEIKFNQCTSLQGPMLQENLYTTTINWYQHL